jgi:hypothetical protein
MGRSNLLPVFAESKIIHTVELGSHN